MTYPTRKQIDELLRLKEAEEDGIALSGDERVSLHRLVDGLAVPMARLHKAAGKGMTNVYLCPEHRTALHVCPPDCWAAALVEIGGAK